MSVSRTRAALALAGLFVLAASSTSHAFSDPSMFARPALAAGGGGRHFTGSPADGYSCNVCHEGGPSPSLAVTGLPLSGYEPGGHYEIVVAWDRGVEKFATALEITDDQGHVAGVVRLPPPEEIQPAEFCEPARDMVLAASLSELGDGRQVIHVPDCGAHQLRFLWTAPKTGTLAVWFSGSAVWSDGEADAYHDGVTDYGRVLSGSGTASSWNAASCAVRARGARSFSPSASLLVLGAWFALAYRRWFRRSRALRRNAQ